MNWYITEIRKLVRRKKVKQIASLYGSMIMGLLIGIGVSVINTRILGPEQYGDLKFLQSLFAFVMTFLTLGIFVTGNRLIAQKKNDNIKHHLVGNLFIFASIMSLILILIFFIFSFYEEQLFKNDLGRVIRIISPLLFVFPFQLCLRTIMSGANRIYDLSVFQIGPKFLYLLAFITFNCFFSVSLLIALILQIGTLMIMIVIMIIRFKPKFHNIKENAVYIWKENKNHGLQVYIGFITGVATVHLSGIFIGYFIDNINVGFFSLALTITGPLTMIPNAVGTTFYKDFANRDSIPRKATLATILLSASVLLIFLLLMERVVLLLYSKQFRAVIPLAYLVSFGSIFHGFGDYLNKFIGAHGMGRYNRNSAICQGLSNLMGYTLLVYAYGLKGAAYTKIISSIIYLSIMIYYYKKLSKYLQKNKKKKQINK